MASGDGGRRLGERAGGGDGVCVCGERDRLGGMGRGRGQEGGRGNTGQHQCPIAHAPQPPPTTHTHPPKEMTMFFCSPSATGLICFFDRCVEPFFDLSSLHKITQCRALTSHTCSTQSQDRTYMAWVHRRK